MKTMRLVYSLTLSGLILCPQTVLAIDYTWNGGTGDWSSAGKWTPSGVPADGDSATVNSGTVTLSGTETVGILNLQGGSLTGPGSLTMTNAFNWSVATIMDFSGILILAHGATATLDGTGNHDIRNGTIQLEGDLNHVGPGHLHFHYGAGMDIRKTGVVDIQGDLAWSHYYGNAAPITNAGRIKKTSGTGQFTFSSITPTNTEDGRIEVHSGTLVFNNGVNGSGVLNASSGAVLHSPNSCSLTNVDLSGFGIKRFSAGNLTLAGDCSGHNVELAGAKLLGSHTLSGSWNWISGLIDGTPEDTTTIADTATLTVTGEGDHEIRNRSLVINGILNHEGPGRLHLNYGPTVQVSLGGVINIQGDLEWAHSWGDAGTIVNDGTISKNAGDGIAVISNNIITNHNLLELTSGSLTLNGVTFNNIGTTRIDTGTLSFSGNGTSPGEWILAEGALLTFTGGSPIIGEVASFTGLGNVKIAGATVAFNGPVRVPRLELSTGTIAGSGVLSVTKAFGWTRNSMVNGALSIVIENGAVGTISGDGDHDFRTGNLIVEGTLEHHGPGNLVFNYGATVDIAIGGVVDIMGDYAWGYNWGDAPVMTNAGTFVKSAGSGDTTIQNVRPTNTPDGTFQALSGTLVLKSGLNGGGTLDASVGALITIPASSSLTSLTLSGEGIKRFTGGDLILAGDCTGNKVELAGTRLLGSHTLRGNWKWISGMIEGQDETTTIASGAVFSVAGEGDHDLRYRTVLIEGFLNHDGPGRLHLNYGPTVQTTLDGVINILGDLEWPHSWGDAGTIINGGTISKSLGDGIAVISNNILTNNNLIELTSGSLTLNGVTFTNNGQARIDAGTLSFSGNGTSTGQWTTAEGTRVNFTGGSPVIGSGSTFTGLGEWKVAGATVYFDGTVSVPRLELNSGKIAGSGMLSVTKAFGWTNDSFVDGTLSIIIEDGAIGTISGEGNHDFRVGNLTVRGTLEHHGPGQLLFNYGATVDNHGVVDIKGDFTWGYHWGDAPTVTNAGIFVKSSGSETATVHNIKPTNTPEGTFEVLSGTLALNSGLNGGGILQAAEGGLLHIPTTSNLTNVNLPGNGIKRFSGGNLTLAGYCSGNNVELAGAKLFGSHTLRGHWYWISGIIEGTTEDTTTIAPGAVLSATGDGDHDIRNRTLSVEGTLNHDGPGRLHLNYGTNLRTVPGGTINIQDDLVWQYSWGNAPAISNEGTIAKTGGEGEVVFNSPRPVNKSTGRIESHSGTIRFPGGVTEGGTFHAAEGAQILIENSSSLTDVRFSGPGIQLLTGGDVTLSGDCHSENLEIHGADILGTHTLHGTWHWRTGEFRGPGTTTLAPYAYLRLIGDTDHILRGRDLTNTGFIWHEGMGRLVLADNASLSNAPTGACVLASDSSWTNAEGQEATFINNGVIYKIGQTGASWFDLDFQNNGALVSYMGWFVVEDWVWHAEQGWIYCIMVDDRSLYYYDAGVDCWAWTGPEYYAWIYWFWPIERWSYCVWAVPGERWFWIYPEDIHKPEEEMMPQPSL
ncbi:MAG: hypothetical protein AB3N64_04615 [Puniceicoccaceae bacterium]